MSTQRIKIIIPDPVEPPRGAVWAAAAAASIHRGLRWIKHRLKQRRGPLQARVAHLRPQP
jgi:hypothetical protein